MLPCAALHPFESRPRIPAFRKGSVDFEQGDYAVANATRMTATEVEPTHAVVTCQNTAEKGVMVALHDPVGETQGIMGLLSVHVMTLNNYSAQHQYPLMIGKAVKNYFDPGKVSTSRLWVLTGPLSEEFEATYNRLRADIALLDAQMARLVWHWVEKLGEDGFGSFLAQLRICQTLVGRYSFDAHWKDHSEVGVYAFGLFSRTKPVVATCGFLETIASTLFGAISLPTAPADKLSVVADVFLPIVGYAQKILTPGKEIHAGFKAALNAVMTVYATAIVQASTSDAVNETSRLRALMFQRHSVVRNTEDLREAFRGMLMPEGYGRTPLPLSADSAMDGASAAQRLESRGTYGQVGFEEYTARIDLALDPNYRKFALISESFDMGAKGFGLVGAYLSLHNTISEWSKVRYEASALGRAGNDPRAQVLAAFSQAYASVYAIAKAGVGMMRPGMSANLATQIFGNAPRLTGTAGFRGAKLLEGAVASKSLAATARIAGGVGIAFSAAQAVEGWHRGDNLMAAGNGIVAVAALALIWVTGPLAFWQVPRFCLALSWRGWLMTISNVG